MGLTELIARAPWREAVTYRDTWPHVPRQLYLPAHCLNKTVTQRKWLPQI